MLRADPTQFVNYESPVNNPVDHIRKLAAMKQHVNSMLFQLGLAKNPPKAAAEGAALVSEPSARNPMHSEPDSGTGSGRSSQPLQHSVVATISTISSTVSTIWANRLNAIIPTQGRLEVAQRKSSSASASASASAATDKDAMKVKPKWPDFLVCWHPHPNPNLTHD
jgi:hypothetical protein